MPAGPDYDVKDFLDKNAGTYGEQVPNIFKKWQGLIAAALGKAQPSTAPALLYGVDQFTCPVVVLPVTEDDCLLTGAGFSHANGNCRFSYMFLRLLEFALQPNLPNIYSSEEQFYTSALK